MTHTPIHRSSVSSLPNYNVLCLLPWRGAHILPTPSPGIATLTPHKRGSPDFVVYGAPRSNSKPPFPASPPALHLLTLLPLPSSFRRTPGISRTMPHVSLPPGVWDQLFPSPGLPSAPRADVASLWHPSDHSIPQSPRPNELFLPLYVDNTCHVALPFLFSMSVFPLN